MRETDCGNSEINSEMADHEALEGISRRVEFLQTCNHLYNVTRGECIRNRDLELRDRITREKAALGVVRGWLRRAGLKQMQRFVKRSTCLGAVMERSSCTAAYFYRTFS